MFDNVQSIRAASAKEVPNFKDMLNEVNHELVLAWKTRFTETMQGRLYWTRQSVKAFSSKPWSDAQHEIIAATVPATTEALKLMDGYISVIQCDG